jgi:hypothetical protein
VHLLCVQRCCDGYSGARYSSTHELYNIDKMLLATAKPAVRCVELKVAGLKKSSSAATQQADSNTSKWHSTSMARIQAELAV